jgi:hypothetical protein
MITRAKKNSGASEPAVPQPTPTRGRPPQYGKIVKLAEVVETHAEQFVQATCTVSGHVETVSYLAVNLWWKPRHAPRRFVCAITSRGPMVLRCSDLESDPLLAITVYCARGRIATVLAMRKGLLGTCTYRFWSKRLPRPTRKPTTNAPRPAPHLEHLETGRSPWEAWERFGMLGCLALGVLQLVALKVPGQFWDGFRLFLRTRSRAVPAARTVKAVRGQERARYFPNVAS